jgi:hypothetical protein
MLLRAAPTLALIALCFVAAPADAQWTWRDKSGQINASDRPPPRDIPDKDILSRPNPNASRVPPAAAASGASAPPLKPLDREIETKKRAADQEQAAKTKAEEERVAAQKAENCRRARAHMAALESGQRIARTNEKGEREILDDRGRADEMRQAREVIASECR